MVRLELPPAPSARKKAPLVRQEFRRNLIDTRYFGFMKLHAGLCVKQTAGREPRMFSGWIPRGNQPG